MSDTIVHLHKVQCPKCHTLLPSDLQVFTEGFDKTVVFNPDPTNEPTFCLSFSCPNHCGHRVTVRWKFADFERKARENEAKRAASPRLAVVGAKPPPPSTDPDRPPIPPSLKNRRSRGRKS